MGKDFKFVHCADLHLGSRFKGMSSVNPDLAERMRLSIMDSFQRIVDRTIEENADALIISGDLYDDGNELPSTRMWFSNQLSRLSIPVFICKGNHDAETSWDSSIPYPENVHEFGIDPESITMGDIEILGVSYSTPHETRNLVSMMEGSPDKFTIACVHCDLESVSEGYSYAPCALGDLTGRSVDYWALGHIHKRALVSTSPYVVYPGNIQGRSFKEAGEKGAYIVTVSSGRVESCDFFATQGYIWNDLEIDIASKDMNDVIKEISMHSGNEGICRVRFVGSGPLDTMLRDQREDLSKLISGSTGCIVSEVIVDTKPVIDISCRVNDKDMGSAVIQSGKKLSELSKDEVIEIICRNPIAKRYRTDLLAMSDEDVRSLIDDAVKDILVKMEVSR